MSSGFALTKIAGKFIILDLTGIISIRPMRKFKKRLQTKEINEIGIL